MSARGDDVVEVRLLGLGDADVLRSVDDDVFDFPVEPALVDEFLNDARHHIAVALHEGRVVGMASAVNYMHPDKPNEFWVNEVGVAERMRRRGIARRLLDVLLAHAREVGCREAWVATEADNAPARALYLAAGGVEEPTVMATFDLTGNEDSTS